MVEAELQGKLSINLIIRITFWGAQLDYRIRRSVGRSGQVTTNNVVGQLHQGLLDPCGQTRTRSLLNDDFYSVQRAEFRSGSVYRPPSSVGPSTTACRAETHTPLAIESPRGNDFLAYIGVHRLDFSTQKPGPRPIIIKSSFLKLLPNIPRPAKPFRVNLRAVYVIFIFIFFSLAMIEYRLRESDQ